MSTWKVILATLVIFTAGLVTGGLVVKDVKKPQRVKEPQAARTEMLRRLTRELGLSSEQRITIDRILQESNERTKILRDLLDPEFKSEYRKAVEDICGQLTPEQRKRFEDALRQRRKQNAPGEKRRQGRPPAIGSQLSATNAQSL